MASRQEIKEHVRKAVKIGSEKTVDALKLLKPHAKKDKFALNYLRNYMTRKEYMRVWARVKQDKAGVKIKRMGYSFLISGRDLLPRVYSSKKLDKDTNKIVESNFFDEKYSSFSDKAWLVLPELLGPNIIIEKRIKSLLALLIFSDDFKVNIIDDSGDVRRLIKQIGSVVDLDARAGKRSIKKCDLNVLENSARLGKFRVIADSASSKVSIRDGDASFLKRYVRDARKIKVTVSKKLIKGLKKPDLLPLMVGSARMDLRDTVSEIDVERVIGLNL